MTQATDFRQYADTGIIVHLAPDHLRIQAVHPPLDQYRPVKWQGVKVWMSRALRALGRKGH